MLEVVEAGLLTIVQDAGRPDWAHLGVPHGGAADTWSLAVANALLGNAPGAAALEVTISGPRLRALADVIGALAGADFGAVVLPSGRSVVRGAPFRLSAGEELDLTGSAPRHGGARAYLAVADGLNVPEVLGSRSTCLAGGFGGFEGRPLQAGDRLPTGEPATTTPRGTWPGAPIAPRVLEADGTLVVRVLPGPHAARATLPTQTWTVAPASDRMGLRLEPALAVAPTVHLVSHGVTRGAVQLPPDGRPIVLLADHQTTGGYPVVAVAITADLPALGQLAPGDRLRFVGVTPADAVHALVDQRAAWRRAVEVLRADATWDDLWHSAGA